MERDVFISHGMAGYLKERFWDSTDGYRVFVGKESETIVVGNPDKDLYMYENKMLNPEDVAEVQMPYAMKLLIHEFTSMGIDFRMVPDDDD
jgi:DNA-directed RNA polymerase II subunit RPB2